MRTRSVAVHLIVKNSATLSLSSFCLDWSLWKEPPIISGQNRVASLFILVNFWWHFLADSHIGKGHSLYTVQCQSEWIYGLSNVERGCLQDSWPQTGGQERWIWCTCSSCCGLLWSPRPLLLCPSEIVNSLAFPYIWYLHISLTFSSSASVCSLECSSMDRTEATGIRLFSGNWKSIVLKYHKSFSAAQVDENQGSFFTHLCW